MTQERPMPADPQSPKVDERRWVLRGQIHELDADEAVEVVPASLVDELRTEVERLSCEASQLNQALGVVEAERDALRAEVERLAGIGTSQRAEIETRHLVTREIEQDHSEARAEIARLQDRIRELEGEGLRLAGLLDPTFAEGARQERERLLAHGSVENAAFALCVYDDQVEWDQADDDDRGHYMAMAEAAFAAVLSGEGRADA